MRTLMVLDAETVVGPCADVPVPVAARPRLLVRGAVHPAIRDAQRRLNAFHAAEVAAGRAGLAGLAVAPLVEDCVFGKATQQALIAFQQQVFPGLTAAHDGRLGPKTWAEFDRVVAPPGPGPGPATPPTPPVPRLTVAKPVSRPCCLLESGSLAGATTVGRHAVMEPKVVYTGKAGFVDLGHLWDTCDVTAFAYSEIHRAGGAVGTRIAVSEGEAVLTSAAPAAEWLDLARAIANDDALVHEIVSYWSMTLGAHHSSFSPEDLCSNNLGTIVGARAATAGGPFVAAAERALTLLLTSLDAQTDAETRAAFARIARRWVDDTKVHAEPLLLGRIVPDNDYLRRRNFAVDPWKTGHKSDATTPAFVVAPITHTATYDFVVTGSAFRKADFPAQITAIRTDARIRYGPHFDKP
jgi:peptidoglycan hydrolase-like protein with peptidoglycan-binding domain